MDDAPMDVATTIVGSRTEPTAEGGEATYVGRTLARYVILGKIGEGGMGQVVRAYDPKLGREVAVKVVHPSLFGEASAARLVSEARAMARISHPNVVSVFDVEELDEGRLALVMEYVPGTDLKSWLAEESRSWDAVVERFVDAGRGLAAAHEAGLLHRDFKPANVLIDDTVGGQSWTVKVTDFGLAKQVAEPSVPPTVSEHSLESSGDLTQTGAIMGTPRYMAPEQYRPDWARAAGGDHLAAAADQYAFCLALWEGIHGSPPFSGSSVVGQKIAGPPDWPSGTDVPSRVADAIVRGLAPKARDRWPDMDALLQELAPKPRRANRKLILAVVGALGVGVAIGAPLQAGSSLCEGAQEQLDAVWGEARRQEVRSRLQAVDAPYADDVAKRTQAALDAYAADWIAMHKDSCEATRVRGDQSEAAMDLRMGCLQRARLRLDAATAELIEADADVLRRAQDIAAALPEISTCADIDGLQSDVAPPLERDRDAVARARQLIAQAETRREAARYDGAQQSLDAALGALDGVDYPPVVSEIALEQGHLLDKLGRYEDSEQELIRSLELAGEAKRWDIMASAARMLMYTVGSNLRRNEEALRYVPIARSLSRTDSGRSSFHNNYGTILSSQGRYAEAEVEHRKALELRRATSGPNSRHTAQSHDNLAIVMEEQGRFEEAEEQYEHALRIRLKLLGPRHPQVGTSHLNIAGLWSYREDFERAEQHARTALELWEEALGPDHPDIAEALNNVGLYVEQQGNPAEGEAYHRRALKIRRAALGDDHADVAMSYNNLAISLQAQGKIDEAITQYEAALELWEKTLGPDHPNIALPTNNLANLVRAREQYSEAEHYYRRALDISENALGPEHPQSCSVRDNLAWTLMDQHRWEDAHPIMVRLLELRESSLGPDSLKVAETRADLAYLELRRGKPERAIPLAEASWERRQRDDADPYARGRIGYDLARALWAAGEGPDAKKRAREIAARALAEFRKVDGEFPEEQAEVEAWVNKHPATSR